MLGRRQLLSSLALLAGAGLAGCRRPRTGPPEVWEPFDEAFQGCEGG